MGNVEFPHKGIETWVNSAGRVVRLHYSADPDKTAEWAERERAGMTDPGRYRQEYEIDFSATLGQRVFLLHEEATLETWFPIPESWTRYFALDPHPAVPHAFLWCAVDPHGTRWYYRELWPSKICGLGGNAPSDDHRHTIREYLEVVRWLESKENPDNDGKDERIFKRVIDYAARAMGKGTTDDPEQPNFQQRYEAIGRELGLEMTFEDAKKDLGVGIEQVNEGLMPRPVLDAARDEYVHRSQIRIFQDKCPELVWELRNNRWRSLGPAQAEFQDHSGQIIEKRKHMTDNLRYIEMARPEYVAAVKRRSTWRPIVRGINY